MGKKTLTYPFETVTITSIDRHTEMLARELYERYRGEMPVLDTENE